MAIKGDARAAAIVMKVVEKRESDSQETLSPMLQALRAIHAKHEADIHAEHEAADQRERHSIRHAD